MKLKIQKRNQGIMYIMISAFFFALMGLFVRLSGDLPSFEKSFFRNAVAAVFAFAVLLKNKTEIKIGKGNLKYLLLRSVCGTIGILCNFYAIDRINLADASILNKMSPFFAIIFSFFLLKEKIKPAQAGIVILAFCGALMIVKPGFKGIEIIPGLLGLAGGIAAGAAYTFVRILSRNKVEGPFIVMFFSLFSCIVILPFFIADFTPMSGMQLLYLLCAGLSAAGGQFSITAAYSCAPAKEISVYDYTQIIFSTLMGFAVFGEIPDGWSFAGYGVIIAAAILMFLYNNNYRKSA